MELEKEPPDGTDLEEAEDKEIKGITIKPSKANIEVNKERRFSVYVPFRIGIGAIPKVRVVSSDNERISVLDPEINVLHIRNIREFCSENSE